MAGVPASLTSATLRPARKLLDDRVGARRFVVLVERHRARRDAVVPQQHAGDARVLGRDHVRRCRGCRPHETSSRADFRAVSRPHIMSPAPRKSVRVPRSPHLPRPRLSSMRNLDPARMIGPAASGQRAAARAGAMCRVVALAFAFACGLSALSAAQTPAASEPATPDVIAAPDVEPARNGTSSPTPNPRPSPKSAARTGPIVLVLPLASDNFRRAAEAVQAGFLAAAEAAKVEASRHRARRRGRDGRPSPRRRPRVRRSSSGLSFATT